MSEIWLMGVVSGDPAPEFKVIPNKRTGSDWKLLNFVVKQPSNSHFLLWECTMWGENAEIMAKKLASGQYVVVKGKYMCDKKKPEKEFLSVSALYTINRPELEDQDDSPF